MSTLALMSIDPDHGTTSPGWVLLAGGGTVAFVGFALLAIQTNALIRDILKDPRQARTDSRFGLVVTAFVGSLIGCLGLALIGLIAYLDSRNAAPPLWHSYLQIYPKVVIGWLAYTAIATVGLAWDLASHRRDLRRQEERDRAIDAIEMSIAIRLPHELDQENAIERVKAAIGFDDNPIYYDIRRDFQCRGMPYLSLNWYRTPLNMSSIGARVAFGDREVFLTGMVDGGEVLPFPTHVATTIREALQR